MVAQIGLPISLAIIMFSMGLALTIGDFIRIKSFPKAFFTGLFLQMIALPVTAFAICYAWMSVTEVNPAFLVGLVLIAACPGGVTSSMLTYLSKGDTALSISLTAIISVIAVFTIPFLTNTALTLFTDSSGPATLPLGKTILGILVITTVPVALGMLVNHKKPELAAKLEAKAKVVSSILFTVIILVAIAKEWSLLKENFQSVGPVAIILNLATMFTALSVARMMSLGEPQRRAIAFECGLQNGTLAITVAFTFLNNQAMGIPGALYSIFMFITGGAYLWWCMRKPTTT